MLKHRVISGSVIFSLLVLAGFKMPAYGVWLLLLFVSALGQLEFYALINNAGIPVYRYLGTISGLAMITATFFSTAGDLPMPTAPYMLENVVLLVTVAAVFVRQFPQKHNKRPLETMGLTLLGSLYVPYFLNYVTRLIFAWDGGSIFDPISHTGRMVVFYFIVVVKAADVGAYFVGMRFGRHKLLPRISPGKSWEGLFGGIGASILASYLFYVCGDGQLGHGVTLHLADVFILGFLLSVVGVLGDLFESLIKRATGSKDSSSVIPGMGGLLDVLDSLLFGAPVMYLYALVFL